LEWMKTHNIAHRGLHTDNEIVPENSLLAMRLAKESGYAMEFDIHITKDDKIVVFHDADLVRMCNANVRVEESTYSDLKQYRLLSSPEKIPLLSDVLDCVNGHTPLLIEIKNTKHIDRICSITLETLKGYSGAYAIQSFNPKIVHWFTKNAPYIKRGMVAYDMKDSSEPWVNKMIIRHMLLSFWVKPDFINYEHLSLPLRKLSKLQKKGVTIIAWTVRTQEELDRVKRHYSNAVFELFVPK